MNIFDTAKQYTALISWKGKLTLGELADEEIDVKAFNEAEARELILKMLEKDYEPGAEIVRIEQWQGDWTGGGNWGGA